MSFLSPATRDKIAQAHALWKDNFGKKLGFFVENHDLAKLTEEDSTGVILALELCRLANEAGKKCLFTAKDLMERPAEVAANLETLKAIRAAAECDEVQNVLISLREMIRSSAGVFGVADKIEPTLANNEIGKLLNTAEREFGRLKVHQFAHGTGKASKFHLNEAVYAFPTMHEMVCALARQPVDGLTLCVLVDPDIPDYSVFAWALRTGYTLTVLSEGNGLSHRGQKFMRRNPGRDADQRANGRFYPYSIFEFEETPTASGSGTQVRTKGFAPAVNSADRAALSMHDIAAHKVRLIRDLEPNEITWLLLLANMIHREYWLGEKKTASLAYTGEMASDPAVVPQLLLSANARTGPVLLAAAGEPLVSPAGELATYEPLRFEPVTGPALTATAADGKNWEGPNDVGGRTGHNDWMVKRYGDQISDQALAQTAAELIALPSSEHPGDDVFSEKFKRRIAGEAEMPLRPILPLTKDGSITTHSMFLESKGMPDANEMYILKPFDPDGLYGTKAEIDRERLYIARSNQAEAIQALADKEFAERAAEIVSWLQERVRSNLPALKAAIGCGQCELPTTVEKDGTSFTNQTEIKNRNILSLSGFHAGDNEANGPWGPWLKCFASFHCGIVKKTAWHHYCVEEADHIGSCRAVFHPTDVCHLAFLVGLEVSQLPDVLQNWHSEHHRSAYIGNSILNFIDPVEKIENPWKRMEFGVRIHFTKRTFKRWTKGEFRDQPALQVSLYPEWAVEKLLDIIPRASQPAAAAR